MSRFFFFVLFVEYNTFVKTIFFSHEKKLHVCAWQALPFEELLNRNRTIIFLNAVIHKKKRINRRRTQNRNEEHSPFLGTCFQSRLVPLSLILTFPILLNLILMIEIYSS